MEAQIEALDNLQVFQLIGLEVMDYELQLANLKDLHDVKQIICSFFGLASHPMLSRRMQQEFHLEHENAKFTVTK